MDRELDGGFEGNTRQKVFNPFPTWPPLNFRQLSLRLVPVRLCMSVVRILFLANFDLEVT